MFQSREGVAIGRDFTRARNSVRQGHVISRRLGLTITGDRSRSVEGTSGKVYSPRVAVHINAGCGSGAVPTASQLMPSG